jgi:hypothetical protein
LPIGKTERPGNARIADLDRGSGIGPVRWKQTFQCPLSPVAGKIVVDVDLLGLTGE